MKCGTHAQVFPKTPAHGNNNSETRQQNEGTMKA